MSEKAIVDGKVYFHNQSMLILSERDVPSLKARYDKVSEKAIVDGKVYFHNQSMLILSERDVPSLKARYDKTPRLS